MASELSWHPISYDSGPPAGGLAAVTATPIPAPHFPEPQKATGRPGELGRVDGLLFAPAALDVLHDAGRKPESVIWVIAHSEKHHCLVFEARQIYCVTIISPTYEAWLDAFRAEDVARYSSTPHVAPETFFIGSGIQSGAVSSFGSIFYEGEWRNPEQRVDQYRTDLHGWLRAASPMLWHGQDGRPEKEAFIADALANASGRSASVDADQVAAAYRRLHSERELEPRAGATDADFAEFAEATGFEIPEELKVVLRIANGCNLASGFCDFMSVQEIVSTWQNGSAVFDEWTLSQLTANCTAPDDRTLALENSPFWIPITNEQTGNQVGIDLLPGPSGVKGQIIYYGVEESHDGVVVIAEDLLDFFNQELAGKIVNMDLFEPGVQDQQIEWVDESWISLKSWAERQRATPASG